MWKIVLNNGIEYIHSRCAVADGLLVCFIDNSNIKDVISGFNDPENTQKIEFYYDDRKDTFIGYIELLSVFKDRYSDEITVTLSKEV